MKLKCPKNPKHKRFNVTAHEVREWIVDEDGEFIKSLKCIDVAHYPERGDLFICFKCGAEAIVED